MISKSPRSFLLLSCAVISLAGCAGTGSHSSVNGMSAVDAALMKAANQTSAQEITPQSLAMLGSLYKSNPDSAEAAIRYARALRESGEYAKGRIVLEPFYENTKSSPVLKAEYATILLEAGQYGQAEKAAQKAVDQDPSIGLSHHILGIALDAQELHKESETAFRNALDNWTGDPVPVMNNLALSLTAQGFLDEAAEILHKAKAADPSRLEIERNLRIVDALRETEFQEVHRGRSGKSAPLPEEKPIEIN